MKESTLATKVMVLVLCVGVLAYLAIYFVQGWEEDLVTTTAYAYVQNVGAQASAVLVRDETVLTAPGEGYVDQILAEGEKAAGGEAVVLLYRDPSALDTRRSIRMLEAEIEQLEYALASGTQSTDSSRLDAQVISSIAALRSLAASGDLSSLEDCALNLRTMVFRRDYTYGDSEAATQLSQLIESKRSELSRLTQSLGQVSTTVYSPAAGVFSGQTDGFETLIVPDMLDTLTVDELSGLLDRSPVTGGTVGKLVTGSTWYLAALLSSEDVNDLQAGRTYSVVFSVDYYGEIPMRLERLERGEDGRALAVFSCHTHLSDTTLLRLQTVDIVTRQLEGVHIPLKALRVMPAEDGQTHYGVYTVVGSQAEWQEVEILYTGDSYYVVQPADASAPSHLRPGDEVILSSSGIFDGKVVR